MNIKYIKFLLVLFRISISMFILENLGLFFDRSLFVLYLLWENLMLVVYFDLFNW